MSGPAAVGPDGAKQTKGVKPNPTFSRLTPVPSAPTQPPPPQRRAAASFIQSPQPTTYGFAFGRG
jgi:hypothetical protein